MDVMSRARVVLLNGFALEMGGWERPTAVCHLSPSEQRLIAYISLSGRPGRAAVAGQLWSDVSECQAKHCLRSVLWRLQKTVPGLVDVSNAALQLAHGVAVDVWEFDQWARRILDPLCDMDCPATPATALQGELLQGWYGAVGCCWNVSGCGYCAFMSWNGWRRSWLTWGVSAKPSRRRLPRSKPEPMRESAHRTRR